MQLLLRKKVPFQWNLECQKAFQDIKAILASPQVMTVPTPKLPLTLYVSTTDNSIGALLAQDGNDRERPIYYLS